MATLKISALRPHKRKMERATHDAHGLSHRKDRALYRDPSKASAALIIESGLDV